jgi:hypothetical protein
MKKIKILLITIILLSAGTFVQQAVAQETTAKTEKEKEAELQKAIDLQKKALAEQKNVMDAQKKELDIKVKNGEMTELEAVKELQDLKEAVKRVPTEVWSADVVDVKGYPSRGSRSSGSRTMTFTGPDAFISTSSGGDAAYFGHGFGGDEERTTWDFSKSVKESTFTKDYSFDVEASANTVVMTVLGDCKMGKIRVKITMPGGKVYSDILIDEFGNLNWRKSFTDLLDINKDKTGEWKFKIEAEKATGFFKISIQAY